jgi:hypothetical protein
MLHPDAFEHVCPGQGPRDSGTTQKVTWSYDLSFPQFCLPVLYPPD